MNIVFDLDGTLIDSAWDIRHIASSILSQWGKDPLSIKETRKFLGGGVELFLERMMSARALGDGEVIKSIIRDDFLSRYVFAVEKTKFYPGVLDALLALKADGHRLGLCTNKPEDAAQAIINHMGMNKLFDVVVAAGALDTIKPEPKMLLQAIYDLGGGASLYVGDSETDAETAGRANVPFALHTRGYRNGPIGSLHYDWAFSKFERLTSIVSDASGIPANCK
tara:strand:+ start:14517 stop:15185 length:669 start_codon:yes stop_codon:yes gene_type:complete